MLRQKPNSYDPKKDSPLIGGYDSRKNINFAAEPEVGWGPYVRTSDLIGLLEQAVKEFCSKEVIEFSFLGKDIYLYDADKVDAWKKKWLTVPPV